MTNGQDPMRVLLWTALGVLGAALLLGAVGGWMWGWGWPWGGMMFVGPLFLLVPVLLIVLLVYALTERSRGGSERDPVAGHASEPGALAVAERRYAAGEITREEYLRIKEDLEGGRSQ